jgi:hypothetical protein
VAFRGDPLPVSWSVWNIIWQPGRSGGSCARLIAMDTGGPGYGVWEEMDRVCGPANAGPIPQGSGITEKIRQYTLARQDKYIGFQVWGDGSRSHKIWEVKLQIDWEF